MQPVSAASVSDLPAMPKTSFARTSPLPSESRDWAPSFVASQSRRATLKRQMSVSLAKLKIPGTKGAPHPQDINQEIDEMKHTIRSYGHGIIHPRTSKWIGYWDAGPLTVERLVELYGLGSTQIPLATNPLTPCVAVRIQKSIH